RAARPGPHARADRSPDARGAAVGGHHRRPAPPGGAGHPGVPAASGRHVEAGGAALGAADAGLHGPGTAAVPGRRPAFLPLQGGIMRLDDTTARTAARWGPPSPPLA